jgi:lysophospholipase L1-like esterase
VSRKRGKPKPPAGFRGFRSSLFWVGVFGAAGVSLWLLGYPSYPGPYEATPGYGFGLLGFGAAAVLPFVLLARGGSEALLAELKRRAPVLLIVGGLLGGLLAAEFGIRLTGRAEWGGGQGPLQPSFRLRTYKMNPDGFRGPSLTKEAMSGRRVLMGLGDSFTFGQGVRWEETFLQRLERAINEDGRLGAVVTVNASYPGWNTAQQLNFLLEKGFERYRPNGMVVQFTLNDAEIQPYYLLPITPWPKFEVTRLWRSHAFFLVVKARNLATRPYEDFIRGLYADRSRTWDVFRRSLAAIAAEARRRGVYPVFVLFPILQDLDEYLFEDIHEKVAAEARSRGFKVVDLLPLYRAYPEPTETLRVSPGDWHPNAEGHRIAAEAILPHFLPKN